MERPQCSDTLSVLGTPRSSPHRLVAVFDWRLAWEQVPQCTCFGDQQLAYKLL